MKRVGVSIKFPAEVHRERDAWVASCPQLHVASQGSTPDEAMAMLQEALALFIEGCCAEGIMDRVLEESGLQVQVTANAEDRAARQDTVSVLGFRESGQVGSHLKLAQCQRVPTVDAGPVSAKRRV